RSAGALRGARRGGQGGGATDRRVRGRQGDESQGGGGAGVEDHRGAAGGQPPRGGREAPTPGADAGEPREPGAARRGLAGVSALPRRDVGDQGGSARRAVEAGGGALPTRRPRRGARGCGLAAGEQPAWSRPSAGGKTAAVFDEGEVSFWPHGL